MGRLLARRRLTLVAVALFAATLVAYVGSRAQGDVAASCARVQEQSVARTALVTGSGRDVVVIGDSYSAGRGLSDLVGSWPSALPGRITVLGFSGSGFGRQASPCPGVSFAERADVARVAAADLVVVQGGLNDYDQPTAAVRDGVRRLLAVLRGQRVVLVGPPSAPARAAAVPRIDDLLASEAARAGVPYVRTSGWGLDYLDDRLHLTPAAHRDFGARVAAALPPA